MATDIYLDTPRILVRWDRHTGWMQVEHRDWSSTDEVRVEIEACLAVMWAHHPMACLSDLRRRRVVQPDAQQMLTEHWIPQAAALGLKRIALVAPTSCCGRTTVESLVKDYGHHVEADLFDTPEAATEWLAGVAAMGTAVGAAVA